MIFIALNSNKNVVHLFMASHDCILWFDHQPNKITTCIRKGRS